MNENSYKKKFIEPFLHLVSILMIVSMLIFITDEFPALSILWKISAILLLAQGVFLLRLSLSILFHFFNTNSNYSRSAPPEQPGH